METFENDGEIPPAIYNAALKYQVSVASIIDTLNNHGFGYDLNQPDFEYTSEIDSLLDDVYFSSKAEEELSSETSEIESIGDLKNQVNVYKKDLVNIKIGIELWPTDEHVIIISTDDFGQIAPHFLNGLVLEKIKVDPNSFRLNKKQLYQISKNGYTTVQFDSRVVHFVSTIQAKSGQVFVDKNRIRASINKIISQLIGNFQLNKRSIYIPLLGTGEANLDVSESFSMIYDIIEKQFYNSQIDIDITISLSPNISTNIFRKILTNLETNWIKVYGSTIENSSSLKNELQIKDKIDFHLDDPALEDKLGRKPIAKSLAKLINDDIFGIKKCYAFMAQLQGRWGEGKSSFMKFLEDGLQETSNNRWIVIHYNAWKNQNVDPPWWTFLDAIYRQGRERLGKKYRRKVILKELMRRINSGILLSISVTAFILLLILSASNLLGISFLDLPETTKVVVSLSTIAASLWAIGQGWSKFFVVDTAENARLFMRKAENPTESIKAHFKELIEDLQTRHSTKEQNYRIAVFIDDLDRCEGSFVVSLLEGIQTMFNEQKVFYLVAADKHWIAKSFENVYSDYSDTVKKGTKLGYSFIEKNFQLSIRLPNPSKEQISRYWDFILNSKGEVKDEATSENIEAFKSELNQTNQSEILSGEADIDELSKKHNLSFEEAQSVVLEKVNESTKDIEHLLRDHHELIGNNPRAVKRLANQYTVYRNLVLIEQSKVDPLKLFRWVVLQNRWPVLVDRIESIPSNIESIDEDFLTEVNLESHSMAINFVIGEGETRLTEDDVIKFTGINTIVSNTLNHA
tara:strand:- start:4239 stop:6638 length:2400 start_codon:yes stop_codon:yes gene_type:complete